MYCVFVQHKSQKSLEDIDINHIRSIFFLFLSVTLINPCLKQQRYQKNCKWLTLMYMSKTSFAFSFLLHMHANYKFNLKCFKLSLFLENIFAFKPKKNLPKTLTYFLFSICVPVVGLRRGKVIWKPCPSLWSLNIIKDWNSQILGSPPALYRRGGVYLVFTNPQCKRRSEERTLKH